MPIINAQNATIVGTREQVQELLAYMTAAGIANLESATLVMTEQPIKPGDLPAIFGGSCDGLVERQEDVSGQCGDGDFGAGGGE